MNIIQRPIFNIFLLCYVLGIIPVVSCSSPTSEDLKTEEPEEEIVVEEKVPEPRPYTPVPGLEQQDEIAIYAAVIRQNAIWYVQNRTLPDTFYVLNKTHDELGWKPGSNTRMLTDTVQREISRLLSDLPVEIVWFDEWEYADMRLLLRVLDESYEIDRRLCIRLSDISIQEDESVKVIDEVYFYPSLFGTTGRRYILDKINGTWDITDDTHWWTVHWD